MSYTPSTPVTGSAQTGFTSPTYTLTADVAPDVNGKQHAITALGGTQAGVTTHSVSSPFTSTFIRPKSFRILGNPNPVTNVISNVANNVYKLVTRKGVSVLAGQPLSTMRVETTIYVPAGSDLADLPNIKAALSAHIGLLNQQSAGIGDTAGSGVF